MRGGLIERSQILDWAIGLSAPEVEYAVFVLQFAGGIIVTLEEAQDEHVTQGLGGGSKMVRDRNVLSFVTNRVQMLYETVSASTLGLTDVEKATSGAVDAIDQ
eukprot:g32640.t1